MNKLAYIVTGSLIVMVEAKNEEAARKKLEEYLCENSPVRDWEIFDLADCPEHSDINIVEGGEK